MTALRVIQIVIDDKSKAARFANVFVKVCKETMK